MSLKLTIKMALMTLKVPRMWHNYEEDIQMSRETERVLRELHKAMEGKEFKSETEINDFMNEFMQTHNANVDKKKSNDAYDYLEMAQDTFDAKEAVRYAQKALKLDPYCLDAELIIAQAKSKDMEELKKNMEKVIRKGEEQLAQRNISKEEDAGSFYGLFETRPYMRVRKEYLNLLITQGRYRHAICEAEELIRLNENDNLGVRYILMALYSYFEDEYEAKTLFDKYPEDSAFMLLPLIALYYKMENNKKMKSYIRKLKNKNPQLQEALEMFKDDADEDEMEEILHAPMYRPFSVEEVVLAFSEAMFLYMPMNGFLDRLYDEAIS